MKRIINAIRDFLYNITDYGLIIAVIVIMVAILAWRFNLLFNKDIEKEVIADGADIIQIDDEHDSTSNLNDNTDEIDDEKPEVSDNEDTEEPDNTDTKEPDDTEGNNVSDVIATIEIPEGSFPSSIGDILVNSNLINNKNEFLNRSVELGLDTRLRSGTFEIAVGTSLDNIIKIIANAN